MQFDHRGKGVWQRRDSVVGGVLRFISVIDRSMVLSSLCHRVFSCHTKVPCSCLYYQHIRDQTTKVLTAVKVKAWEATVICGSVWSCRSLLMD